MTRQNFLKICFQIILSFVSVGLLNWNSCQWHFYFEYHYWDQSKQERKASRLANKNEDITFFVTSASVLLLVKNTINYFSSEGLCYNLSFTQYFIYHQIYLLQWRI